MAEPDHRAEEAFRALPEDAAKQLYDEICTNIRTTDDVSFKLLGLVPLVSGSGILGLLSAHVSGHLAEGPLVFVGALGALVTFGLSRWERRNIQTCNWLIAVGAELERHRLGLERGQFLGREPKPRFLGLGFGKTEAERVIYWSVIVGWALLPVVGLFAD